MDEQGERVLRECSVDGTTKLGNPWLFWACMNLMGMQNWSTGPLDCSTGLITNFDGLHSSSKVMSLIFSAVLVSEPDHWKIRRRDRLGWKCTVHLESRCASDWSCLRAFIGNTNHNPL